MKFDQVQPGMVFETYARNGVPSERWAVIDVDRDGGRLLYDKNGKRRSWCSALTWNERSNQVKLIGPNDDNAKSRTSTVPSTAPIVIRTLDDSTALLREMKDLLAEILVELRAVK